MDEPVTEPDASEVLDSEGLLVLRHLFSDDDDDDLESVEAPSNNPEDDSSSSSDDDESDSDDDMDSETVKTDDHGNPASQMDVESQPLFSSEESAPAPLEQREPSAFGPMRSARRLPGRRQPAPMPEPLQDLHRIMTSPAPVSSGRAGRDAAVPAALSPPLPLLIMVIARSLESFNLHFQDNDAKLPGF